MSVIETSQPDELRPPTWAAGLFTSVLEPFEGTGQTGLWTIRDGETSSTITSQFTDDAGIYDSRYAASKHFLKLFKQGFAATGVVLPPDPVILDLGSGSGANSVLPCLELFLSPEIVATDLSPQLLGMLASRIAGHDLASRVIPVVMDAMSTHVESGRFDLVTGAAILHHLERPEEGLRAARRALKPGGTAIFFEPFDGYCLLRLAHQRILAEGLRQSLDPAIEDVLKRMIKDTAARTYPDPKSAAWRGLDDKWLFSREYIQDAANAAGFSDVQFVCHTDTRRLFRNYGNFQLTIATGRSDLVMPDWANEILDEFDDAITLAGKRAMMLEATVVLTA